MFTRNGKGLTAKGVKPVCLFQQVFQSTYLFGAFSPITGNHFELEMPHCNTDIFQVYLNEFSRLSTNKFKILMLDNGAFHKGQNLRIPENIAILFFSPYSPELNPAEKIWQKMKRAFSGKLHKTLDNGSEFITNQVTILTNQEMKSICRSEYIFLPPYWTNTY